MIKLKSFKDCKNRIDKLELIHYKILGTYPLTLIKCRKGSWFTWVQTPPSPLNLVISNIFITFVKSSIKNIWYERKIIL